MHIIQKPVKPYLIMYVYIRHVVAKCKRADHICWVIRRLPVIYLQPPTQTPHLWTP